MKKSKIVLLSMVLILLLCFSLFSVSVEVNAASEDEIDIEDIWVEIGLPLSAIDYVDLDGKGIKFYVNRVIDIYDDVSGDRYQLLEVIPVEDYYFDEFIIEDGDYYFIPYSFPYSFLFSDFLVSTLSYYLNTYDFSDDIPVWDRIVIHWDVDQQKFEGSNYLFYWIDTLYNEGYDEGYDVGYDEGYDVGNEDGYNEGYQDGTTVNHEAAYYAGYDTGYGAGYEAGYDDARPELDILLITLIMYILSIIIYFKFNLKWVLIATTLLWFVPIFLVENLFIKIFSVIMIIVTITITFFGEREVEY